MKTKPNKVYSDGDAFCEQNIFKPSEVAEYIRKDIHDETIKTAEDHAYFAGKEKLREELLEWAEKKHDKAFRLHLKKGDNYAYGQGKMDAYQKLIDKLNQI